MGSYPLNATDPSVLLLFTSSWRLVQKKKII